MMFTIEVNGGQAPLKRFAPSGHHIALEVDRRCVDERVYGGHVGVDKT